MELTPDPFDLFRRLELTPDPFDLFVVVFHELCEQWEKQIKPRERDYEKAHKTAMEWESKLCEMERVPTKPPDGQDGLAIKEFRYEKDVEVERNGIKMKGRKVIIVHVYYDRDGKIIRIRQTSDVF